MGAAPSAPAPPPTLVEELLATAQANQVAVLLASGLVLLAGSMMTGSLIQRSTLKSLKSDEQSAAAAKLQGVHRGKSQRRASTQADLAAALEWKVRRSGVASKHVGHTNSRQRLRSSAAGSRSSVPGVLRKQQEHGRRLARGCHHQGDRLRVSKIHDLQAGLEQLAQGKEGAGFLERWPYSTHSRPMKRKRTSVAAHATHMQRPRLIRWDKSCGHTLPPPPRACGRLCACLLFVHRAGLTMER